MDDREQVLARIESAKREQLKAKSALDSAVDYFQRAWWLRHEAELELRRLDSNRHWNAK